MVTLSLIGMIMVYTVSNEHKYTRLAGIWIGAIFGANVPIALSLITSNVGGFTKRATVSAMLFIGYCAGNIIGPQFFYTREKPRYPVSLHLFSSFDCTSLRFSLHTRPMLILL
jgi:hypothetical protein